VIFVSAGSALAGICSSTVPSEDATDPPCAPTTADAGAPVLVVPPSGDDVGSGLEVEQ
jgi:hypothetical protein